MVSTNEFITDLCNEVATRMTALGLPGSKLRERTHLDPIMKDAVGEAVGTCPTSQQFRSPLSVGLGGCVFSEDAWKA